MITLEFEEKLTQFSAGYNGTDEAETCSFNDAETDISMVEDNFPECTLTIAVVCLYSIHNLTGIQICFMTEVNVKHAYTVQI